MNTAEQIEAFVALHRDDDVKELALGPARNSLSPDLFRQALIRIEALQHLKTKLPGLAASNNLEIPSRLAAEQCSSEATARLKRELIASALDSRPIVRAADLTGGLGIDTIELSKLCPEFHYIEQNPELATAAQHNLSRLAPNVTIHNCPAEQWLAQQTDELSFIYLDPARRSQAGRKVFLIDDCTPSVATLRPTLTALAPLTAVKLSPMLDLTELIRRLRPTHIYIVSLNNECKELLALIRRAEPEAAHTRIEAIEINRNGTTTRTSFTPDEESKAQAAQAETIEAGMWLYEPNAALMKSGAWRTIAQRTATTMLSKDAHLYLSPEQRPFPGREFRIESIDEFNRHTMARLTARLGRTNIIARAFPMTTDEVRQRFKIKEGGHTTLLLTQFRNKKIIITLI